jgi:hypothetical protein
MNMRTAALVAAGIVSAGSVGFADEASTHPVISALTATTISGYVDTSIIYDLGQYGGNTRLPGRSFDGPDKVDSINLNVVKLSIEKPLDDSPWSAGYKVDLLFGPDANTLATSSVLGQNNSDFAIKQAYVALRADIGNGLDFKLGVFDTVIGYEVFEAGNNPNYSRSYAYYIEPTQHTGLLATYQLAEWLTVSAGVADAWNARINAKGTEDGETRDWGAQTALASVAITLPDDAGFLRGTTIYGGVVYGLGSEELNDADQRASFYAGVTIPTPMTGLAVGVAYDYRCTERTRPGYSAGPGEEYATTIGGYLIWQAQEKLKLSLRGEYAQGSAGTWGAKFPGAYDDVNDVWIPASSNNEQFFGLTATADYSLWANVISRLEFRWDRDLSGGVPAFGGADPGEEESDAYILALNVIYKF